MSKEMDLLKKILATGWLDHELSCEVKELLAQPEQEQEPVATKLESHQFTAFHVSADDFKKLQKLPTGTKIYTAPPKREPLSIQEIYDLDRYSQQPFEIYTVRECISWIRKVEKAHGIGVDDE